MAELLTKRGINDGINLSKCTAGGRFVSDVEWEIRAKINLEFHSTGDNRRLGFMCCQQAVGLGALGLWKAEVCNPNERQSVVC